jgi:hypothetical protein
MLIAYLLTGISALFGLVVGLAGGLASYMILSSATVSLTSVDFMIGLGVLLVAVLYAAHPVVAIQLIKHGEFVWCYLYDVLFIGLSIILLPLLGNGIAAASI